MRRPACPKVYEPQGDTVCFDSNGSGYFTVSEEKHSPIYIGDGRNKKGLHIQAF
jgi:hypothetical protein